MTTANPTNTGASYTLPITAQARDSDPARWRWGSWGVGRGWEGGTMPRICVDTKQTLITSAAGVGQVGAGAWDFSWENMI